MKIIFKFISVIIILVIVIVGLMFMLKICPPAGPWPMPPWCSESSFERIEYETPYESQNLELIKAVNMSDTWGKNYNFSMFESTRNNIESSFTEVASLGAQEVYVHDFHRAVYEGEVDFASTNYQIVDEIFSNDFRDESMTREDVENLVNIAHQKGLKLGIKHNMAFVDIGKYIKEAGNIGEAVTKDFAAFNSGHTAEWTQDFFSKWQERLVEKAKIYETAGVDIMSITPTWMGPTFPGQEVLANKLKKDLIVELQKYFSGDIHVIVNDYGFIDGKNADEDWNKYDYYQEADIVEFDIYALRDSYQIQKNPTKDQIKESLTKYVDDIEKQAQAKGVYITIAFYPFSYADGINQGIIEYHDISGNSLTGIERDWDHQADAYQALFETLVGRKYINRVVAGGYWWDNAMDPKVKVKISLSPSFRNKPAQAVIKKWFTNN